MQLEDENRKLVQLELTKKRGITMTKRRIISLILLIVFCITTAAPVIGAEQERDIYFEPFAEKLKSIGMFKGTDRGFELDRQPTRAEAAVIIVRLLGKESEVQETNYEHPFLDVPQWADPYVGYLYQNKITSGVSDTKYASNDLINIQQFMTLLLRVLNYDDKNGDFQWDKSLEKAVELNIVSEEYAKFFEQDSFPFIRDDIVYLLIKLLGTKIKDSEYTLMDKLVDDKVLTLDQAIDSGIYYKSITVEKKGVIISYSDKLVPVIEKVQDGSKWVNFHDMDNETKHITSLTVCGDDLREYKILLQKDYGFDEDSIKGKSITFTGDLVFHVSGYEDKTRYIDLESYTIVDLQDDADYEPVIYNGKFIPNGHSYDIGGQTGFTLITADGEKYSALMGIHKLMDIAQEMDEGAYVSYNLLDYTNDDVWVKGYKKKDSTLLYVTEFGREFMWDENTEQWVKKENFEYGSYLIFATLTNQIENSDDRVTFEGTFSTLHNYDELPIVLTFDKSKLGNKVPNETFFDKTIIVYCSPDTDIFNTSNIEVQDWYFDGATFENTSACYGTLSKVLEDNSEYIEFELTNNETPIKSVRFYKNDFFGIDFYPLTSETVYVEGVLVHDNFETIRVIAWLIMYDDEIIRSSNI